MESAWIADLVSDHDHKARARGVLFALYPSCRLPPAAVHLTAAHGEMDGNDKFFLGRFKAKTPSTLTLVFYVPKLGSVYCSACSDIESLDPP